MKRKICLFDIDGTLLDHFNGGILPKSAHLALTMLRQNNHIIGIASGKGPVYIENFIPDIKFDTYIALNGNYVMLEGKLIYKDVFDKDLAAKFVNFCIEKDIPFSVGDIDGTKTLWENNQSILNYYNGFNMDYPRLVESIDNLDDIMQMTICITKEREKEILPFFPEMIFARMNLYGLNVNPGGGLKEKGIKALLDNSDYTADDLVVFGDGLNDIGMFDLANTSVALGNADPLLKKHATYITDFVNEQGIYNACFHLGLIYKK
ncbi:Cof-type HAD-IIB family hydrolase [Mycoplasma sp. P36-A1]|uniref:Cof-type HAD-IIB family hydrolase n=1 Tax=Mycoplasma sp. P36-A1 TaxID=3252900 RepID=UPI003C2B63A7